MVGIIEKKLTNAYIHFNSRHGSPTQGLIHTEEGLLYFRFRGSQFKVVVQEMKGVDHYTGAEDRVVFMRYYFYRDNMSEDLIKRTLNHLIEWA